MKALLQAAGQVNCKGSNQSEMIITAHTPQFATYTSFFRTLVTRAQNVRSQ